MSDISEFQPDIAVTSSRLEEDALAGLQVLLELRTLQTSPRVIMLLDDDQSELVIELFRNGARGIFCRTEIPPQLRKCIQCVYMGQIWANNTRLESIVDAFSNDEKAACWLHGHRAHVSAAALMASLTVHVHFDSVRPVSRSSPLTR